jgi:signal transduction histidine kinase
MSERDETLGTSPAADAARLAAGVDDPVLVEASRDLLAELMQTLERPGGDEGAAWPGPLPHAESLGQAWYAAGASAAATAREIARLGRRLEEAFEARELMTAPLRRRLSVLIAEATAQAVDAASVAAARRRDGRLSFYCHELRNPLNTIVNAVWILRNQGDSPQTQRVCDMADRAIAKMEKLIQDLRGLELKTTVEPPTRPKVQ